MHNSLALILPVSLALMSYILPLKGEMCSAMVSAAEGEDLASLQAKAFSAFRSACRKPTKSSCKYFISALYGTIYLQVGSSFPFYHISRQKLVYFGKFSRMPLKAGVKVRRAVRSFGSVPVSPVATQYPTCRGKDQHLLLFINARIDFVLQNFVNTYIYG